VENIGSKNLKKLRIQPNTQVNNENSKTMNSQWLTPIILATQGAEIRRIMV
jgi:hypothetical protein